MKQDTLEEFRERILSVLYSNINECISITREFITWAEGEKYNPGIALGYYYSGLGHSLINDYPAGFSHLTRALQLVRYLEDRSLEVQIMNAFCILYSKMGYPERSIEIAMRGIALAEVIDDQRIKLHIMQNKAISYSDLGMKEEALSSFYQVMEVAKFQKELQVVLTASNNITMVLLDLERVDEAEKELLRSADIHAEICARGRGNVSRFNDLLNRGRFFALKRDFDQADRNFQKAVADAEERGSVSDLVTIHIDWGKALLKRDASMAVIKLKTALDHCDEDHQHRLIDAYEVLAEALEEMEDFEESAIYWKKAHQERINIDRRMMKIKLGMAQLMQSLETEMQEAEIIRTKHLRLNRAYNHLKLLQEVTKQFSSTLDLEVLLSSVYKAINRMIPADAFGIALYNESENIVEFKYFIENGERVPVFHRPLNPKNSYVSWAVVHKQNVFIRDEEKEYGRYLSASSHATEVRIRSVIVVPLIFEKKTIGALTLQAQPKEAFSDDDLLLIESLSSSISVALENSLAHEQIQTLHSAVLREKQELQTAYSKMQEIADHDALTGLINRRALEQRMEPFFRQSITTENFALFFMDLDGFKDINDVYGHDVGDEVLQIVTKRIEGALRKTDLLARIGGDEFIAVLLNPKGDTGLNRVAGMIVDKLAQPIQTVEHSVSLSVSIGIVVNGASNPSYSHVLKKADEAMYAAKEKGRSCFVFADRKAPGSETGGSYHV